MIEAAAQAFSRAEESGLGAKDSAAVALLDVSAPGVAKAAADARAHAEARITRASQLRSVIEGASGPATL